MKSFNAKNSIQKSVLVFIIFLCALSSLPAQSDETNKHSCDFLVTIAFPQLLTGKNLTQPETQLLLMLAQNEGIVHVNGTVNDREKLIEMALTLLERKEIGISIGSAPTDKAVLVGYLLEIADKNVHHFVLAGTNKKPLFNPCNVKGKTLSSQEVYVFAK